MGPRVTGTAMKTRGGIETPGGVLARVVSCKVLAAYRNKEVDHVKILRLRSLQAAPWRCAQQIFLTVLNEICAFVVASAESPCKM